VLPGDVESGRVLGIEIPNGKIEVKKERISMSKSFVKIMF
jgi:hypothetical protein